MTRDAFRRLGLLLGCSGWVLAIVLVWLWIAWVAGLACALIGPLLTVALTIEQRTPAAPEVKPDPQGMSRREIAKLARSGELEDAA